VTEARKRRTDTSARRPAVSGRKSKRGRPRGTGTETVYRYVRAEILNLTLTPGTDLDENRLVSRFKVSRTPVREALIRLSSEGLLTLLPNIGARVASLSANEVPHILEALELAQRATTRWAAIRRRPADIDSIKLACEAFTVAIRQQDFDEMTDANYAFHLAIATAAHNSLLAGFHASLQSYTLRLSRLTFAEAPFSDREYKAYYDQVDSQHRQLVDAIVSQDADKADRLARDHVALFRHRVIRQLSQSLASNLEIGDGDAEH
jgi:DNA-binding GntR family transcriptional regulator